MTHPLRRPALLAALASGLAGALSLLPATALAHVGVAGGAHHGLGAFAAGFAHPFTGADHLLAMVGIGLWSATRAQARWAAPLAFMVALLAGALLGQAGVQLPAVEPMIAASLLVIGLLAAMRARLSTAAGVGIAALFALFHGAAHGSEFGSGASAGSAAALLAGMLLASLVLHLTGFVGGAALQGRAGWLARAAGAAVAGFGALLLAGAPLLG